MAVKIGRAVTRILNFTLQAKELKIKNGKPQIKLAALPQEPTFKPGAALIAHLKDGKKKFSLSSRLKKALKVIGWEKSKLKPLKDDLKKLLESGKKNPAKVLDLLAAFLKRRNCLPDFSISFTPPSIPPTSPELTPDVPVDELTFQILLNRVKAKHGRVKVKLDSILEGGLSRKTKVTASINHGTIAFKYSKQLKEYLSQIQWTVDDLKPLHHFLKDTLKTSHKDPVIAVDMLSIYLKSGIASNVVVKKSIDNLPAL